MYAYMHTCIHAYMHTSIQAYMHTCIHAYMHTCIHAYMHTCIHAYMHTCIHAYMHTCIHAYIHTYIHTYIHVCVCTSLFIHMCARMLIMRTRCRKHSEATVQERSKCGIDRSLLLRGVLYALFFCTAGSTVIPESRSRHEAVEDQSADKSSEVYAWRQFRSGNLSLSGVSS